MPLRDSQVQLPKLSETIIVVVKGGERMLQFKPAEEIDSAIYICRRVKSQEFQNHGSLCHFQKAVSIK